MNGAAGRARAVAAAAAAIGLFAATAVIAYFHAGGVFGAMRPLGIAGFAAVIAAQVALFAPLGLAWWLMSDAPAARLPLFAYARLMREAASDVLPFSQLGGVLIAVRAAVLGGVSAAAAAGACAADITLEVAAQIIYTLCGLALLAIRLGAAGGQGDRLIGPMLGGLALASAAVGALAFTQNRGLRMTEALAHRLPDAVARHASALRAAVDTAWRRPARLWFGLFVHVGAWFGAAAGSWLILRFIRHPLPFLSVVGVESLLFAIRNAAFVVPSGIGVQEAAYAFLGPLFGLPPQAALALSLIKRARDIVIGVPTLLSWQGLEARRRRTGRGGA